MSKNIYLTFKTTEELSFKLKCAAKAMNMTQPELINYLCSKFIQNLDNEIKNDPPQ